MKSKRQLSCDLTTLSRLVFQCSTLVNAGLGLLPALRTLSDQQEHPALAAALPVLCKKVESGHTLSRCMGEYPALFSTTVVYLVRAGEESGRMAELLRRLALWLEKDAGVWSRTRQAMVYPATVLATATLLGWLLFTFFLPPFFESFTSTGAPLPTLTQVVLLFTRVVGHPLFWVGTLAGLWFLRRALARAWQRPEARLRLFRLLRALPLLGKATMLTATVRFANCLAVLLDCGLPLVRAWLLATAASGDAVLERDAERVVGLIREGETLSLALGDSSVYPAGFASLLGAAEESGALPTTLTSLADVYDQEVEYLVSSLSVVFEPIFIAGLAVMVVTILLAVLLPLYGTLDQLGG